MLTRSRKKNTENSSGENRQYLLKVFLWFLLVLSDDSDKTGEIPEMFSENGAAETPGKVTGKRHGSFASSHISDDFGESEEKNFSESAVMLKTERESPYPREAMEVSLPASVDLKKERPPKEDIQNKLNKFCSVCQVRKI